MMANQRINLAGTDVAKKLSRMTEDEFRAYHVVASRRVLDFHQASGQFPTRRSDYRTIVDRRKFDVDETQVRAYGRIDYSKKYSIFEIVSEIRDMLLQLSPVLTGQYMASHTLTVNNFHVRWDNLAGLSKAVTAKDKIKIVNVLPYARKIEGGDISVPGTGKKRDPQSMQAPNGVYRVVYRKIKQKFGRSAFIKYQFSTIVDAPLVGITRPRSSTSPTRAPQRYPTLVITPSTGTLGS